MIVDTSALIAILKREPDAHLYREALTRRPARISAATWLETTLVARRVSERYVEALDLLLSDIGITIVPVSVEQAQAARYAHHRYGKGTGSRAQLNFGDCFSYALAITEQDELLFKGNDFTQTDVLSAL